MLSKLMDSSSGGDGCSGRKALLVAAGLGVAAAAGYGLYVYLRRRADSTPPTEWRRAGEVTDLWIYPIKSCGGVRVRSFHCTRLGPQQRALRDRVFMVVESKDDSFITGRSHPRLVLVQPEFDESREFLMTLTAPGMAPIALDLSDDWLRQQPLRPASVWSQPVDVVDCGDEVARWLSRFLLDEGKICLRLMYYPHGYPTRPVRPKNRIHQALTPRDSGALHDATSFMLVSEESVADVNGRLQVPVPPLQYRANILIRGVGAFEEDSWKWYKIGGAVYQNIKPCTRCLFTNVDPKTGVSSPDGEPLTTLKKYRKKPGLGDSPVVGAQMGVRIEGSVSVGDVVYVA